MFVVCVCVSVFAALCCEIRSIFITTDQCLPLASRNPLFSNTVSLIKRLVSGENVLISVSKLAGGSDNNVLFHNVSSRLLQLTRGYEQTGICVGFLNLI